MPQKSFPTTTFAPWTASDIQSQGVKVDYALEGSRLIVATLQNIGSMSGIPFLNEAAGIALRILTIVQDVRNNNQAFADLASDACGLVYTIVIECQTMIKNGDKVPERVQVHIAALARNLSEIEKFTQEKLKRGAFKQIIRHSKDIDDIARYRALLRQSLDVFGIQASISIQQNLQRVLQNIEKQREELKLDRARQDDEKRRLEEDLQSQMEILRIQQEDREAERLSAAQKENNDRRQQLERSQERRRRAKRNEQERLEARLWRRTDDVLQERQRRTPSPQPPLYDESHYVGYPPSVPLYPYPSYPLSPYSLAPTIPPYSSISGGGLPVHFSSYNSGNVSNTVITNSMNNYAGRKSAWQQSDSEESDED